ncbi:MAG: riboflavin synthase [Microcoleus sp. PH2017_40_RAT_O_B]|uniref:riboflavin synthase n=1 Tax=unclassified Microcoleus TaxID=2642155 RepID=UPI001D873892|nr:MULTISPECIES: riboflavin synthase [unclassified Microcoleus]MCC3572404.1 riboflavin synthase [Microcoleus sp. PH2017_34_RAT_O_A]MCC3610001.1 riboflavin synthase [Microcoleus sp. PH2017_40_RAT_O_B]
MFTGLIQSLGKLKSLGNDYFQISCTSSNSYQILQDLAIGDSVAVDGVCLTVVEVLPQGFVAIASPETLRRTNLGAFPDAWVNLETSLRAGSKLGGHFVTGHVDAIGTLATSTQTANAWEMRFTAPPTANSGWQRQIAPYIVSKGSIAVNGISLTVADCDADGNWFEVAVIPHSFSETNLSYLQPGSLVNLEADILGKYVAKFLRSGGREAHPEPWEETPAMNSLGTITPEFLAEHGFI